MEFEVSFARQEEEVEYLRELLLLLWWFGFGAFIHFIHVSSFFFLFFNGFPDFLECRWILHMYVCMYIQ